MSNNQKNAKKEISNVNAEISSKEKKEISEISLDKYADALGKMEIKEKGEIANKELLYIYPENWSKREINGMEGKNFRSKKRREMESLTNNILFYAKGKKIDDLKSAIDKFLSHYKMFYRRNDLSLNSISNGRDAIKSDSIRIALEIVKDSI